MFTFPVAHFGGAAEAFAVDNSAVFNDDDTEYLTRTPSGAGNTKTWTVSFWWKPGKITTASAKDTLFSARSANPYLVLQTNDNSPIASLFFAQYNGSGYDFQFVTDAVFRDPHAWYNIVIAVDTTQSTDTNRVKMYVNGSQATFGTASYPAQDLVTYWNTTYAQRIGMDFGSQPLDGYLAEWVNVDGSALAPTSFGEYDSNGVWRPKNVSGLDVGTQGFYLNFAASGSNLGDDASGSNDLTNTNSATQSGDSPTTNHCVWSPLTMNINASSSLTLSSGNLVVRNTASEDTNVHGSFGVSAGKWYFEVTVDTINEIFLGVSDATIASNANAKNEAGAFVLDLKNADKYNNDGGSSYGSAFSNSDVANVALDLDNGKIWIGKDGTYPNSGNPATGANEMYSGISGTFFPFLSTQGGGTKQATTNFGQSSFTTSAPTGFEPWNTAKLYEDAAPSIEDGTTDFVVATATEANIASTLATARSGFTNYLDLLVNRDTGESRLWRFSHDTSNEHAQGASSSYGSTSTLSGSDDWIGLSWKVDGTAKIRAGSASHSNGSDTTVSFTTVGTTRYWAMIFERGSSKPVTFHHPDMDSGKLANFCNQSNPATDDRIHTFAATSFVIDADEASNTYDYIVWPEIDGFCSLFKFNCNSGANGPLISMNLSPKASFIRANSGGVSNTWLTDNVRQTYNALTVGTAMDGANAEGAMADVDYLSNGIKYRESGDTNEETDSIGISWADHAFAGTTAATAR